MSYSYDRRTAAKSQPKKLMVPRDEREEAIKHLAAVQWLMKEWVIRSNPDARGRGHPADDVYGATDATYEKMAKLRDEFDDVKEKISRL